MRFSATRPALSPAVETACRFISGRCPLPILHFVLLEAREDGLYLTATDLNIGVHLRCDAQIEIGGEGAVTVPSDVLAEYVKKLPDGHPIHFALLREGTVEVKAGRSHQQMAALPAEEFPSLPAPGAEGFNLPQRVVRRLTRHVLFAAAAADEARPVMTGALVLLQPDNVTMVTTDGRRMAAARQDLPLDDDRHGQIVVPAKTLAEMARLLKDEDEPASFHLSQSTLHMRVGDTQVNGRLLEGAFPDFNRVIPKAFQRSVRFKVKDMRQALDRVLLMAKEKDSPGLVRFEFNRDHAKLSSFTPDLGQAEDEIPIQLEGEPLTIAFNGNYLKDGLTNLIDGDEAQLDLQDESHSGVLRPVPGAAAEGESCQYVVMPVRLREPFPEPAGAPA